MNESNDPRVFFSAERTLLAWIRTGLTVMGLGFVVARFGLFLRLMAHDTSAEGSTTSSTMLGVAFVLLGSAGIAIGVVQFMRFCREIPENERPRGYWTDSSAVFGAFLAVTGVILAVYLLVRSHLG